MVDVAGVHPSIKPYQRRRGIVHVAGVPASTTSHRKRREMRYRYRLILRMLLVATAQQIAAAAGSLADLAGNLEATAATTRERY